MCKKIDRFEGKYEFLSNFYVLEHPITIWLKGQGYDFYHTEGAFQASKCDNIEDIDRFLGLRPGQTKRLGRNVKLRSDWENVKIDVMTQVVRQKFECNPELLQRLLDTAPAKLEEGNNHGDQVWGTVDGVGTNYLGKVLMKIRDEFQAAREAKDGE